MVHQNWTEKLDRTGPLNTSCIDRTLKHYTWLQTWIMCSGPTHMGSRAKAFDLAWPGLILFESVYYLYLGLFFLYFWSIFILLLVAWLCEVCNVDSYRHLVDFIYFLYFFLLTYYSPVLIQTTHHQECVWMRQTSGPNNITSVVLGLVF